MVVLCMRDSRYCDECVRLGRVRFALFIHVLMCGAVMQTDQGSEMRGKLLGKLLVQIVRCDRSDPRKLLASSAVYKAFQAYSASQSNFCSPLTLTQRLPKARLLRIPAVRNMATTYKSLCDQVKNMGASSPNEISTMLARHLPYVDRTIEQFSIIEKTAVRQHAHGSSYVGGDIKWGGVPLLNGQQDMPYHYLKNLSPELDRECMGYPVNFAIYNGEAYLHCKWSGFKLSKAGDDDTMTPFRVVDDGWEHRDTVGAIRDTYIMFRNLLTCGMHVDYLQFKVQNAVDAVKSSFAELNLQVLPAVPTGIMSLVAHEGVIENVVRLGAFEIMDPECEAAASRVQQHVMRVWNVRFVPMDCSSRCSGAMSELDWLVNELDDTDMDY